MDISIGTVDTNDSAGEMTQSALKGSDSRELKNTMKFGLSEAWAHHK